MKKQEFKNMRRGLGTLQDNFKRSNIWIIGVPEGEEEQEIENLYEKIMKNFPNLAKEIDFQKVQEAQKVPKKSDPRTHQGTLELNYPTLKIRREL